MRSGQYCYTGNRGEILPTERQANSEAVLAKAPSIESTKSGVCGGVTENVTLLGRERIDCFTELSGV